jgi:hypothetical protein
VGTLNAEQKQIVIDAILHMEGTDESKTSFSPTEPGWGGKASALSYGRFQNDISQGENKYDTISSSQALLEMLENHHYDRTLDKKSLRMLRPGWGKAIFQQSNQAGQKYSDVISSALSDPENLPIWQAQDIADEKLVIDRLNEAINRINEKNPDGAGVLSWSSLDPNALMALAAWTNHRHHAPTGHRDDPIYIHPNG